MKKFVAVAALAISAVLGVVGYSVSVPHPGGVTWQADSVTWQTTQHPDSVSWQ